MDRVRERRSFAPAPIEFAAVCAVVAALDGLSLYLMRHHVHVATLWPAKGVVLALLLRRDVPRSMLVLAAAFVGGVAAKLAASDPLHVALLGTSVGVGGIALAFALIRKFIGRSLDFRDWKKLLGFLAITIVASAITAIPGAGFSSWARGAGLLDNWMTWMLSTCLSYAILTPLLALGIRPRGRSSGLEHHAQKVILTALGTAVVLVLVFAQSSYPLTYLVPIALLIVALIAEVEGVVLALLLTAIVSIAFTVSGHGPAMLNHGTPAAQILSIQILLAVLTVSILPAAAAITERRQLRDTVSDALHRAEHAAIALQASEERYRLMAENASDIMMQSDLSGRITYMAPSVKTITGFEPESFIGKKAESFIEPDDVAGLRDAIRQALSDDAPNVYRSVEYRARHKDGRPLWLEAHPTIARDNSGKTIGIFDIVRDITARKSLEADLVSARQRAEAATAAKSEFLANMSHELRTPLTSIIGFADLLYEHGSLDAAAQNYVARVRTGSHALLATINDILDFSKLEAGHIEFIPVATDIEALARDVLDVLAVQASAKGIELKLDTSIHGIALMIDPLRLRQVFMNLVGNAVKFTDRGSVAVMLAAEVGRNSAVLHCTVTDTGCGIPADLTDHLFERFSQVDGSTSRRYRGTGLGLAICKGIVEAMGGTIGVKSEAGQGSTFWFTCTVPSAEIIAGKEQRHVA